MRAFARLVLLILAAALFVQLVRGTTRAWLWAKFVGRPAPAGTAR